VSWEGVLTRALEEQVEELEAEGCSVDSRHPGLPDGLRPGDQLRLRRHDGAREALFTVAFHDEGEDHRTRVRLTAEGRERLGYPEATGVRLRLSSAVVAGFTEAEARERGELIELVRVAPAAASRLLILAPHGGDMERGTDRLAEWLAGATALAGTTSLWVCKGYDPAGAAKRRWHITSTSLSERSFPGLAQVGGERQYELALSVHGHGGSEILVGGGGGPALRERVAEALRTLEPEAPVQLVGEGHRLAGVHPRNVVNRYSAGGVQVELPRAVRLERWQVVAEALLRVYDQL
jgi:phage replication-related protein YjqB (UPF0714/DUF867 family)